MTNRGHDDQSDSAPEGEDTDEIFAAGAGRRPEPAPPDESAVDDELPHGWTDAAAPDSRSPDAPTNGDRSPYPDDPTNRGGSFAPDDLSNRASPPSSPDGSGLGPAVGGYPQNPFGSGPGYGQGPRPPYPAGPPQPPGHPEAPGYQGAQRFGRRAPRRGPQPDAQGYYPSDYYIGPDWMRIVVGGLVGAIVLVALVGGGFYLYDRYGPDGEEEITAVATPTPLPLVPVFQCAGDAQPVTEMMAPTDALIAGRTADSRWLAFRNPSAPPLQLWVRATSVPDYDAQQVGIVSCASSPNEFPTPATAPRAPVATPTPLASGDQG